MAKRPDPAMALLDMLVVWLAGAVERASALSIEEALAERVLVMKARHGLSARQAEVLGHLVHGLSNKEIAAALHCSDATVEAHVSQLLRRAGVDSRTRLMAYFWGATA